MDSSRTETSRHEGLLDRFEKLSLGHYGFLQNTEPNSIITSSYAAAAAESKGNGDNGITKMPSDRVSSYCSSQTESSKPNGGKLMGSINSTTCDKDCYKCVFPFMCDDLGSESTSMVKNVEYYPMCDEDCYKCWPYGNTTHNLMSASRAGRTKCAIPYLCSDSSFKSTGMVKNVEKYYPMCDEDCYKFWPYGCTTNNLRSVTEASRNMHSKCASPFMCSDSGLDSANMLKNIEKNYPMCDEDCYKCVSPFMCDNLGSESTSMVKNVEYYPMCDEDCYKCWPYGNTTDNLTSVSGAGRTKCAIPFLCSDSSFKSTSMVKNVEKYYPMCDEDCYKCWPYGCTTNNLRSVTEASRNMHSKCASPFMCSDSGLDNANMLKNIEKNYPMSDEDCYKCFPGSYCCNTTHDLKSGSGASQNKYSKKSSD